ncbi:MAG: hypothetical protein AB8F95_19055 [Bacteroidia bacterium]
MFSKYSLILIVCLFAFACEDDPQTDPDHDNPASDSTAIVEDIDPEIAGEAESAGILGRWELVEKRLPFSVKMSGTYFTFSSEGQLTISNPGDPDLEDRVIPFAYTDSSLTFEETYKLLFISGDSLVFEGETDGIREVNILKRK